MRFLEAIRRRAEDREAVFPWTLPIVAGLEELHFSQPITFLAGENGSGKSTFLEGLATGMQAVAMGRQWTIDRDETLAAARHFAGGFRFVRRRHARTRMFLRAEDVFGFVLKVRDEIEGFEEEAEAASRAHPEGSWGQAMATGLVRGQAGMLASAYGENPDARSHGETFLEFLNLRLAPQGLYFLDEPETPLSPQRVLALISMLKRGVAEGSQFVIATHSPLLMATPQSEILLFAEDTIRPVPWDELEHVRLTRDFLTDPERYLRQL